MLTKSSATFTADIDVLKGNYSIHCWACKLTRIANSGGPLINSVDSSVIGIVRSGTVWPLSNSSVTDSSQFASDVRSWTRGKSLSPVAAVELVKTGKSLTSITGGLPESVAIDDAWLHGSRELRTTDRGNQVYWARYLADSELIRKLNRFTRVDAPVYFTRSIKELQKIEYPAAKVLMSVVVKLSSTGGNLKTDVGLVVKSATSESADADVLKQSNDGWPKGSILKWDLTTKDDGTVPQANTSKGNLSRSLEEWKNGLCDWASVEVRLTSGSWTTSQCYPQSVTVLARFKRQKEETKWPDENFVFGINLDCKKPQSPGNKIQPVRSRSHNLDCMITNFDP